MRGLQRALDAGYCYSFIAYVNPTDHYRYTACMIKYLKIIRRSLEVSYPELAGKTDSNTCPCSMPLKVPSSHVFRCQVLRLGAELNVFSLLVR